MNRSDAPWNCTAAYAYLLGATNTDLAWEYLRRNLAYRNDWALPHEAQLLVARHWGCSFLEDPDLDARVAWVLWQPVPASVARLIIEHPGNNGPRFSLWALPGHRALVHDGRAIHVRCSGQSHLVDVAIPPDLEEGMPFLFGVTPGRSHRANSTAATRLNELLLATPSISSGQVRRRPTRTSLTHLRTIQALDGAIHGASHREIAIALFGIHSVRRDWSADGELRARVRYLIRRGEQLSSSGYRQLVGLPRPHPGDFAAERDSP